MQRYRGAINCPKAVGGRLIGRAMCTEVRYHSAGSGQAIINHRRTGLVLSIPRLTSDPYFQPTIYHSFTGRRCCVCTLQNSADNHLLLFIDDGMSLPPFQ